MDSTKSQQLSLEYSFKCCDCSCCSLSWDRTLKRKYDQISSSSSHNNNGVVSDSLTIARVEIENECAALREALSSQQQTMQDLCTELEEERNAAASAANEAMAMILRLQREKAEIQMEARQFKSFTDERTAHDQQQLLLFEDLLYKKDQIIQSLNCEVQAYKHRLMSFGYTEAEAEGMISGVDICESDEQRFDYDYPPLDYPPLRCNSNEAPGSNDVGNELPSDLDKYVFGEVPHSRDHLQDLEFRIHQLETSSNIKPSVGTEYPSTKNFIEKTVVGQSPRQSRHARKSSNESANSLPGIVKEIGQEDCPQSKVDNVGDDTDDRVYTVDFVHGVACNGESKINGGAYTNHVASAKESSVRFDMGDTDIKKLYVRLQALEADRESMRQEIMLMQTNKAHLMLMKEMSQLLVKRMVPERQVIVKTSTSWASSFVSILKWIVSLIFVRKVRRIKYIIESSSNNLGLLVLLEKSPSMARRWKCITMDAIS